MPQRSCTDGETTAALTDIHGGISQKQLADRLGVSREAVRRNLDRGAEHFASWSQGGNDDPRYRKLADPDGYQWERRSNGLFYPLVEEGSESNLAEDDA